MTTAILVNIAANIVLLWGLAIITEVRLLRLRQQIEELRTQSNRIENKST